VLDKKYSKSRLAKFQKCNLFASESSKNGVPLLAGLKDLF
jgi:hypothetical protein